MRQSSGTVHAREDASMANLLSFICGCILAFLLMWSFKF